ncbi:hypothetical protein A1O1_01456 [Capronia coronata CBS 617.96]|uniref:PNPLA domain-containing protein n=1 Tax=Capronia coronata CBS 617.96 TaxID=1182541 RepID=W9Z307_9EURO|nr:uncharacterized protein A1O1_01456 [Capronia coronata CBS 617.96]EXJ96330.1 hypothetical protein A1O1_01456 [Capronia coronata CBS 617.96]
MAQAVSVDRATGGPSNPVDSTGLCLLSLDGGGVRGLSTLHILKSIMTRLNHERRESGASELKPCELFDLIGGTSTGGLIAIMLGRLEMDVDECITAYNRLIKAVFEQKAHWTPLSWRGQVQPRFDSAKLKAVIDEVITSRGYSPTEPFNNGKSHGCHVFVCTAAKDLYGITRLRSYDLPEKPSVPATISEAALATSAATGFFDPVFIGARQFVDGALGVNNPVEEVEGEASDIWCADTGDVKSLVKCFISIGTGNPGKKAIEHNLLKFLSQTLVQITTETEETAKRFVGRWRQHFVQNRYFRLNVEQGLQDVDLAEYKEQGRIEEAAHQYLDDQQQIFRVRDCVANLKQKQKARTVNVHWSVRRPVHTLFTGRDCILASLEDKIQKALVEVTPTVQCRIVISGMGGQGKSEICLQLAQRLRTLFWGVFWVDVSTSSLAENGFLDIATRLQISASTWEDGRQALANVQQPWMLVLDNADDLDVDYQTYFPPGSAGVMVLTSRNEECQQYATADFVALEGLTTEEATALLLKVAGVAPGAAGEQHSVRNDDARRVATLLQSHPLALIQAGAYVKRGHCGLAEYPRVYERQRKRLLRFRPSQVQSRYRDVYATFEASVEILQASPTESSHDALELLPLLAVGGPSPLPLSLFAAAWTGAHGIREGEPGDEDDLRLTTWHVSCLPSWITVGADAWDSFRLVEAVSALRALALVSRHVEDGQVRVSMHPLVHAWARDRQDERRQHASWVAMSCVVALSGGDDMWRVQARLLQPHVQATTSWEMGCMFGSAPRAAVAGILVACRLLIDGGWICMTSWVGTY